MAFGLSGRLRARVSFVFVSVCLGDRVEPLRVFDVVWSDGASPRVGEVALAATRGRALLKEVDCCFHTFKLKRLKY